MRSTPPILSGDESDEQTPVPSTVKYCPRRVRVAEPRARRAPGAPARRRRRAAGTAFNFLNTTANSSSVTITVRGNFRNVTPDLTPYAGVVTFQFAGQSLQEVLGVISRRRLNHDDVRGEFRPAEPPAE